MEREGPGIVIARAPHGEGDLVVTLLTPAGPWRGLAKGGASRRQSGLWEPGNIVAARWTARLPEQLGSYAGELVHPAAALAMSVPDSLAVLRAACALAAGALHEREAAPAAFQGLLRLLAGIESPGFALPEYCRWEVVLLREAGFGLDFTAPPGGNDGLAYVSPRTGRAVTLSQAGAWVERLLPLPGFLLGAGAPQLRDCVAALGLTGHFLARDVFGARHLPLPPARQALYERLAARLAEQEGGDAG